jgi:type IV fimbrial biogenesis protein FimT
MSLSSSVHTSSISTARAEGTAVQTFPLVNFRPYCFRRYLACTRQRPAAAFTLVEVTISLALLAMISLILIPAFGHWITRLRVESTVQALRASVAYARAETLRRGAPTTLCRSSADGRCSTAPRHCAGEVATGDDWRCGWLVVAGHRRDIGDRLSASVTPEVLRRFPGIDSVSLIADRNVSPLTFLPPSGQSNGSPGTIQIRPYQRAVSPKRPAGKGDSATDQWRCMFFSMTGRPRVQPGVCR